MALTFSKLFQPVQLGTTASTIYTCPAVPSSSVIKNGRVRLTNTTASAATATLYAVPSGGTASATNEFISALSVAANSYVDIDLPTMAAGDFLQGLSGTASAISVFEIGGVIYS